MRLLKLLVCQLFLPFTTKHLAHANLDPIEGRYSFSLTTFHPSGKLPQLEHALKASTLGPPIIAVSLPTKKCILLASIQSLPSPLINDDGTSRFVKISKSIIIGHSGVNADGRVLCEAAQRLSVEHTYTFNEEIPVDVLLEEMSLLFQEYTIKPGCRPFGCSLIVASLNSNNSHDHRCRLFRIDPTGTVTKLDSIAFAGRANGVKIMEKINNANCLNAKSIDEAEQILKQILENNGDKRFNEIETSDKSEQTDPSSISVLLAKLTGA